MRVLALPLSLLLCTCSAPTQNDPLSVQAASQVSTDVGVPVHEAFATAAAKFDTSAAAFAAAPDATTLAQVRADWKAARLAFRATDALGFGPVEDLRISEAIDYWPARTDSIEELIAGTDSLEVDALVALGANKKGFAALEYLLFGVDADILTAMGANARRPAFVANLAHALSLKANMLRDAWAGANGYAALLGSPGNATFPTAKASIDTIVNQSFFLGDLVANGVIGKPSGLRTGGAVDVTQERSRLSGNSLAEIKASIDSMKNVYDHGLGVLVKARSTTVDTQVLAQFDTVYAAITAVPEPFTDSMTTHATEVHTMYIAIRDLKGVYAAEVSTALGVTLRFSDSDGD